jgi:hypothetical protein
MSFSLADQNKAARQFFRSELKDLEAANTAALRTTAAAVKREMGKQLRKFKKGPTGNGSFQKAIRIKELRPSGSLPFAVVVRLGVPFMSAFEEGAKITSPRNLIILLPQGAALGFRRISKGNKWASIWARIAKVARIIPVADGKVVAISKDGRNVPIYKIQKSVQLPKKISFFATAESIAGNMAELVEQLLGG